MSAPRCHRRLRGARRECGQRVVLTTDGFGRVHEICPTCARTNAGLCRECPARVAGNALYCDGCRKARHRRLDERRRDQPERLRQRKRADRARWKAIQAEPAQHQAYLARRKAWRDANPEKIKQSKRRYHLKRTPGYVCGYQRKNADPVRQERKRVQSRERYYRLHPTRPAPICVACGGAIAWTPPGRPPKRCDACVPPSVARRRKAPRVVRQSEGAPA